MSLAAYRSAVWQINTFSEKPTLPASNQSSSPDIYLSPGCMLLDFWLYITHIYRLLFRCLAWQLSKKTVPDVCVRLIGCFSCSIPRRQFVDLNRWRSPIRKAGGWMGGMGERSNSFSLSLPGDGQLILAYRYKTNITCVLEGKIVWKKRERNKRGEGKSACDLIS